MSFSNQTPNYDLPQFLSSDKANWFDLNTAFSVIDTAMQANKTAAANAEGEAANATATAEAVQAALNAIQQNLPMEIARPIIKNPAIEKNVNITLKSWGSVKSIYGGFEGNTLPDSSPYMLGTFVNCSIDQIVNIYNSGIGYNHKTAKYYPITIRLRPSEGNVTLEAIPLTVNDEVGNLWNMWFTTTIVRTSFRVN